MTHHVSNSRNKRFCVRALPVEELATIAEHLGTCSVCLDQFTKTLRSRRGSAPVEFTLAPEFWFRHEHVDYGQLVGLADKTLDSTEREIIDVHLKVCASCPEDVRSFLAFREQLARETQVGYAADKPSPTGEKFSWFASWRGLAWKPAYSAAIIIVGIAIVIGAALLLKRRAENLQAQQVSTPQVTRGSTPDKRAANVPPPPDTSNESPTEKQSEEAIVVLNDRGGTITVDKSGKVSGLDDVPSPTRDAIAKMLLTERIEPPAILKNLAGQESALRGSSKQSFKLISPTRSVIVSDRPTFEWEAVFGATTYRVYVNDPNGHIAARSEELAPNRTTWRVPTSLKRGETYMWTVGAVIEGKEIIAPGVSVPEMKFQVISTGNLHQLNNLKKTRSHLALAVFYSKVGLIADAKHHFQILVRQNPASPQLRRLLTQAQSLQSR